MITCQAVDGRLVRLGRRDPGVSDDQAGRAFYLVGDSLWLDFVNTQAVEAGQSVDLLRGFEDLVAWCVSARVVGAAQAKALVRRGAGRSESDHAFRRALDLRQALRDMAERIAGQATIVPQATLEHINGALRARAGELEVVRTKAGYETRFRPRYDEPRHLLVPIAESAAELLSDRGHAPVRKCQNPGCILYFSDTTKNHSRRWCSMTACGNRAKVAAHYRRTHQIAIPSAKASR